MKEPGLPQSQIAVHVPRGREKAQDHTDRTSS